MCGIVAVLSRRSSREAPDAGELVGALDEVGRAVAEAALALRQGEPDRAIGLVAEAAAALVAVEQVLRGTPGLTCLLAGDEVPARLAAALAPASAALDALEEDLDAGALPLAPAALEAVNAALGRLRDARWALEHDRLGAAADVRALAGPRQPVTPSQLAGRWAINVALSSIDRLEVRGRDSAGIHVLVTGHGLDLAAAELADQLGPRSGDELFTSAAVRSPGGALSFVYKAASEIGELGDNVRALRAAVAADELLARALAAPTAQVTVLGHTRWASVGLISEANAHPLNSEELDRPGGPYVTAALNGDVDNHIALRLSEGLRFAAEITTDAKVIPALVSRRLAEGAGIDDAFASTVARFDGSVAIGVSVADDPDRVHLALRGSGQSLNIGLAEDAFVVASEAYGLVEEADRFVRMDGEATQGQIVVLDRAGAGGLDGMARRRYDGGRLPVGDDDVSVAAITTRDIDRRQFPHFLLKEINEAPSSFRKTLRGKIVVGAGDRWSVTLPPESLPAEVVAAVAEKRIRRVVVIGQGTAAVAGRAVAAAFSRVLPGIPSTATLATELSGFGLSDDMSDTVVVAVSQSGTTTDTNRTVDLVRARGAQVLAIVNRRNSDLVTKAHGTLYTSDGRDVEMSVASTKAFYAQVAAGWLLACGLASACGLDDAEDVDRLLRSLRSIPDAMQSILSPATREAIAAVASAAAPRRRYWTVVGSGPDAIAAAEVRIKLSELCYRSIACDRTEDKKHIDLSCEPLILVCAAGLSGANADDVAKEVAIFRAHKAVPIVVVGEDQAQRFAADAEVIGVPTIDPSLAFVLSAMVGHLFGYEAAVAIDGQANPLRAARAAIEAALADSDGNVTDLEVGPAVAEAAAPFLAGLRNRSYDGNLDPSTAVRLVSLIHYVTGSLPVDSYETESGKVGSPGVLVADLLDALGEGVDELTRPVDAIRHQAKTVTVGTSRNEDALLAVPLVKETLAVGASADVLGYRALRTLAALDEAVEAVVGFTRYRIDEDARGATISVVDQGGVAAGLRSRTLEDPRLRGTKHRAAEEREVTVARGASDGRTVVIVPEAKAAVVTGMTLLHVRFVGADAGVGGLDAERTRAVLTGYRGRYNALRDAVMETEPVFDDGRLATVSLVDLLTEPVYVLARHWRSADQPGRP